MAATQGVNDASNQRSASMKNGFTVTGESACASPENFDAELGRKIARRNAEAKIWPLLGYALREKLHAAEAAR
jgi:hypothetical protein